MKTTLLHSKHSAIVRPAALALALLSIVTMPPAYAADPATCDVNNAVNGDEQDSGSNVTGMSSFACGHSNSVNGNFSTAFGVGTVAQGSGNVAMGGWFDENNNGVFDIDVDTDGDNIPDASSELTRAIGNGATAIGSGSWAMSNRATAVGAGNLASGDSSSAFGNSNIANADFGTSVGFSNEANGIGSVSVGTDNLADADGSHAFGSFNQALGVDSTAIGTFAISSGANSTALGFFAMATGNNSIAAGGFFDRNGNGMQEVDETTLAGEAHSAAFGPGAHAVNVRTVAIGAGSQALALDSVALGAMSVADRINTVSVGATGAERQIVNVADGEFDTDAVNKRQLDDTLDKAYAYTDMVVENSGVSQVDLDAIKDYADLGDQQTLDAANNHADAGDAATLSSAKAYTDDQIQQLTGFDANSFRGRLGALEHRVGELGTRIDRGNAMGAALAGMSANAVAGSGPNGRIAIGVGAQGGKRAAAFGYGKKFNRASFTLGGAFSGTEKAVNAGFGFDL